MQAATLSWWGTFPMATALILMVHRYCRRLFDTDQNPAFRAFLVWTAKGVALPFAVWIVLNTGILPGVPILLLEVAILKGQGAPWFRFMLAAALAKLNFGNYRDAERDILRELERCEDNFDGRMMLANLYANKFNDVPGADRTIRELCSQPNDVVNTLPLKSLLEELPFRRHHTKLIPYGR